MGLKIVIVEDEIMVARRIQMFCKNILGDKAESLVHFSIFEDAEDYLNDHNIDILFLDLNLHNKDGFELLKNRLALGFNTIVISASTDRAIEAFEYGVLDFIGKPFKQERLRTAFERLEQHRDSYKNRKYLAIKKYGRIEMCNTDDILFIKAAGHYCELHMLDGKTELHDKNLDRLLGILPKQFERVHKSYAVPINKIKSLRKYAGSQYKLELSNNVMIPLGRTRYANLKLILESS